MIVCPSSPSVCCAVLVVLLGCPAPSQCSVCNSTGCYEHNSPPCWRCADGQSSAGCPLPENCGFAPVSCVGCMAGMAMPGCPYPDYCSAASSSSEECVMSMVFHSSSAVCVLLSGWYVSSGGQWLLLVLFVASLAGLREFLLVYRQHRARQRRLLRTEQRDNAALSPADKPAPMHSSSEPLSLSWPSSPARFFRPTERAVEQHDSRRSALLSSQPGVGTSPLLSQLPSTLSWSDVGSASVDSLNYLVSMSLAYVLMLLVMSYNVSLCVLVVLLSAVAHWSVNLCFTAWWRRDAQLRAARRISHARDSEADGVQHHHRQQRGGYVEVGAPPVVIEEVRAASDPCCGNVDGDFD